MAGSILLDLEITGPEGFQEYLKLAGPTVRYDEGKVLLGGAAPENLEGDWHPRLLSISEFESNDLVWLPPALFSSADAQVRATVRSREPARGTASGGGAEAMFILLSDTEVSGRLKHPDKGGNR